MTTDYNVNVIVSGGVQDMMAANAAVQGGGDAGAQSLPLLQAQKLATQQIQKEIIARIPPLDRFFKGMGIEVSIKSLLKQSQIFTSTIGALFQMFGAMIDMMLAPFTKYIVLLVEKFAEWIPKMGQVAIWAEKYLFAPIISVITGIHSFLNDPPKAMGNLLTKMGAPDWLVNFLGGGGDTGDGGEGGGGGGGFLGGALGDAMVAVLGGAAVGAAFSKSIRRGLTNLFMATVDIPGSGIPGVRNLTSWRKAGDPIKEWLKLGRETSEIGQVSKTRAVSFSKVGDIINDTDAAAKSFGSKIISRLGEIWPAVKPHLDSLVDGVRAAFSASSGRSIPALILTGIAAIAIGAYSIFSGGASTIARSIAPVSRIATRYGLGGRGTPAGEGLMTPVDDLPNTRPPSTSMWGRSVNRFKSVANWRPFQGGGDALNEMVPGRVQTGTPYSIKGGSEAASVAKVGSKSWFRTFLPVVASFFAIWQGADQMNRDRQTEAFKEMPMFRHSTAGDDFAKQAIDEITGWTASGSMIPGMGKFQTGNMTQYDLMMSSMQGMVVGAITGLLGFGPGTAGQAYQESKQMLNNQATGQAWDTGTLLAPLLDLANWAGLTKYNPTASTTNVTVNFANGRTETVNVGADEAAFEIDTNNGDSIQVEQKTVTSTTRVLAATTPTEWDNTYLIG